MFITLNPQLNAYVIADGERFSCLGYDSARGHTDQIAAELKRPDLAFVEDDVGELSGYEKYIDALAARAESPRHEITYFEPGTSRKVKRVLEAARADARRLRLILGNVSTGEPWLDDRDVVGHIGRSLGPLKVPLLVETGQRGGQAILTSHVLALIDWGTGAFLYRHPAYQPPALTVHPSSDTRLPWDVQLAGQTVASFEDIGCAGAYVAFMRGATVEPRIFQ
jgi:hypothetical protein